jgi:hypothetical protein
MKRAQRLQSAQAWLATYQGKKIGRDYRRRYGVDWPTAFNELEMLDVAIDPGYKKRVLQSEEARLVAKRRKKAEREAKLEAAPGYDQDEHFAFIMGYTSGGFPYGLTWEQWAEIETSEALEEVIDQDDK